jgi:hypothetical protein
MNNPSSVAFCLLLRYFYNILGAMQGVEKSSAEQTKN